MHTPSEHDELNGEGGEQTRLHLSGVETPIVTRITRQSERGMTVEQALPFLQLRTQVWGDAQRPSRIESVSVVVYDGMPRLVLDLAYDEHDDVGPAAPQPVQARRAHTGVVRSRQRKDETVPFEQPALQLTSSKPPPLPAATRENSLLFKTQREEAARPLAPEVSALQLSVMERELLQPKDWVFHTRLAWKRSQPHLQRAAATSWQLMQAGMRRAAPLLRSVAIKASWYGRRAWQRVAARRSYSARPTESASPTLPSQS